MEKIIIAAVADNGAIGKDNSLLWHLHADMKFFRENTSGSAVVMGRKTFESIGRALPKRLNIVVSRTPGAVFPGASAAASLDEAFALAEAEGYERCFVIGGGQLYAAAMAIADKLVITRVHLSPEADTFFPEINPELWDPETIIPAEPEDGINFEFVTYSRRSR